MNKMENKQLTIKGIYPVEFTFAKKQDYYKTVTDSLRMCKSSRIEYEKDGSVYGYIDDENRKDISFNEKSLTAELLTEEASNIFGIKWPVVIGANN